MKLKVFVSLLFVAMPFFILAQDKPNEEPKYGWQNEVIGGINLNQTSFDNWSQGGENNFAWQLNINFKFINDQAKTNWATSGKLSYGESKTGDLESRKSVDEIKLESVLTYKSGQFLNPFVAVTGETQFIAGYTYDPKVQISNFLDPGFFRESIGVGYKPNDIIQTRLGAAMKQTVTDKFTARYTGQTDNKIINKVGAESVTDVNLKISESSIFTSKLELFSELKSIETTDVYWDNILTAKINKYFNMNFNVKLLYDRNISTKRQLKQAIALGLTYTFL